MVIYDTMKKAHLFYKNKGWIIMIHSELKALVVANEISLNQLARHFGIERKFKWDDSLLLGESQLTGILKDPKNKLVYIFHFGTIVLINFHAHEMMDLLNYLKEVEKNIHPNSPFEYTDDYNIEIVQDQQPSLSNDSLAVLEINGYEQEIAATVLAKSVALEKIEKQIDRLLDDIEEIVTSLKQGKLSISDDRLAKISASILGVKYNSLSYIMILDKPDITWINEGAGTLFTELGTLFELDDRYGKIRHKTEILMDITEVFTSLSHAKRGTRLEWAIIILIAIELCLSIFNTFFHNL